MIVDRNFIFVKFGNLVPLIFVSFVGVAMIDKMGFDDISIKILSLCVVISFIEMFMGIIGIYIHNKKIYGKHFIDYYFYEEWKYSHNFFILKKLVNLFRKIIFTIFSISSFTIYNNEKLVAYRVFLIYLYLSTLFQMTIGICVSLNTYWIIYYCLCKRVNQYKLPNSVKRNITKPEDDCSICYDNNNNEWIELGCGHTFHYECGYIWIRINGTCPMCRQNVN